MSSFYCEWRDLVTDTPVCDADAAYVLTYAECRRCPEGGCRGVNLCAPHTAIARRDDALEIVAVGSLGGAA